MPRVAMVIQRYLPHQGGAERQLKQLAPLLRARGFDLSILTRHEKGLAYYEVIDGVPVHRLPSIGPKPLAAATFTMSAVLLLFKLNPDIVHAHEILSPASIAVLSKRMRKHPVVLKILRGGARGDVFKLKRRPFWKSYLGNLNQMVDAFVAISQEIGNELSLLGVPDEKRIFIPNGVDTGRFAPISEDAKIKLRTRLALPATATIVVYAGRLVPEKRVDLLLKIWKEVHSKHPNSCLLIVGQGSEADRLKKISGDGVQFTGQVEEATPYLQAADLFVLPSSTEGLSNAMLEAMSCGLPVLSTNVGGAPDVIQHNLSGYLIPAEDMLSLQQGLETLLDDSTLRFRLGSNARARILSDFSLDSIAERLAALYYRLFEA